MEEEKVKVPKVEKHKGFFWIPPFPPHWEDWIGEYASREEAEEARIGLEKTINTIDWQMFLEELVDDFEQQWSEMEKRNFNG